MSMHIENTAFAQTTLCSSFL